MKRALLLLAIVLLAGCGGKKSHRPAPPPPSRPAQAGSVPQSAPDLPETRLSQAERYRQAQDDGPREAVDVSRIEEPEPRSEPLSR